MSDAETGKLDVEKLSFEESMSMLEELVKKLEGGNLDLDESDRKVQAIMETASGAKKEDFTELE